GARRAQCQRAGGAGRGTLARYFAQADGERLAERHSYRHVEAAAAHRQAGSFAGGGGNAHAGVATDALAGLVDHVGMGKILREAAARSRKTVDIHVVFGGESSNQTAVGFAAAASQATARLADGILVEAPHAALDVAKNGGALGVVH